MRPSLADTARSALGSGPDALLAEWLAGPRTEDRAAALVAPWRVEGTIACSDTSGLTRLTRERPPLTVLARISRPKAILHGLGGAVGGRAVGLWVADNAEMFFPEGVPTEDVARAMVEVHRRVPKDGPAVGIALHRGAFVDFGGGLLGDEREWIAAIAEDETAGGETVVSDAVAEHLGDGWRLERRDDVGAWRVLAAPPAGDLACEDVAWPMPWDAAFADLLARADEPGLADRAAAWVRDRTVVVAARCRRERGWRGLLDGMVEDRAFGRRVESLQADAEVRVAGALAILAFADPRKAVDAAVALRADDVRVGVERGELLLFSLDDGPEFAGDAINVASKLAEDTASPGDVLVGERAAREVGCAGEGVLVERSGVRLGAVRLVGGAGAPIGRMA